ncbi:unnamed protein product [Dicrocoelium dendriticum]|nr:unnamed protein product [Dicrocoelium dendriticum]
MACIDQAAKPLHQHTLEHLMQSCTLAAHLSANATRNDAERRSHSYINLQLPIPLSTGTLNRTVEVSQAPQTTSMATSKHAIASDSTEPVKNQPSPEGAAYTSDNNRIVDGPEDRSPMKFCWSPRFPPDGAACYENSPPNTSVPSSPTTKCGQEFDLLDSSKGKWSILPTPLCIHQPDGSRKICHRILNKLPASSTHISTALHTDSPSTTQASEVCQSHVSCVSTVDLPVDQIRHASESAALVENDRRDYHVNKVPMSLASTPQDVPAPPVTSTPAQCFVLNAAECSGTHATCNRPAQVGLQQNVGIDGLSGNLDPFMHLVQRPHQLSSPSLSTPSPPLAPAVPLRDPTTVLQQDCQPQNAEHFLIDMKHAALTTPICSSDLASNPQSNSVPTISDPTATPGSSPNPQESAVRSPDTSNGYPQHQAGSACNTPTRKSPFSILKPNTYHLTTDTTVPDADVVAIPLNYTKTVSLPKHTISTTSSDGRTVVPWCLGTRELAENGIHSQSIAEEESNFLTGFVSASSSFYDSSPQWIRPDRLSPSEHMLSDGSKILRRQRSHGQAEDPQLVLASDNTSAHNSRVSIGHPKHPTDDFKKQGNGVLPFSRTVSCRGERDAYGPPVALNTDSSHPNSQPADQGQGQRRPNRLGEDELFYRQLSAGPSFSVTSTKPDSSSSNSLSMITDNTKPLRSPSGTQPLSTAPYCRRRHTTDEVTNVRNKHLHASTGCSGKLPQMQAGKPHRLLNTGLLATDLSRIGWHSDRSTFEMSQFTNSDFTNSCNYGESRVPGYSSTMTQSVLSPPHAPWAPCQNIPPRPTQAFSVSGRRRRVKTGLARSHSQRKVDEFDVHPLTNETVLDHFGQEVSTANYRRIASHTVPIQSIDNGGSWPTVLAQWHHPKTSVNCLDGYCAPISERKMMRDHLSTKSGRSSHDLRSNESGKLAAPHCRSASAIFERLDRELWFHFDLSRANAECLLKSARAGSFLVRQSETNKSEYSLSIRRETGVLHMKISRDPSSGQYVLGEYSQPYPSISAMIHRYTKSLLPVHGTTPILLRYPVDRRVPQQPTP